MRMRTILLLAICLFSGCATIPTSRTETRDAFWGIRSELDGTEYFRIGSVLIKTQDPYPR
jgi:hypothetical protein